MPKDSDPPVIALARPADPADAQLLRWTKDSNNPLSVSGPIRFESPSNVWNTKTGAFNMNMVLLQNLSGESGTTARYTTRDTSFRNWTLADRSFFTMRGGGGGIFLPIFPHGPNASLSKYTHLMQVYRPSHADPHNSHDGEPWFVLGSYDELREVFENASAPQPLDVGTFNVYSQLGWVDGRLLHIGWLPDPLRLTNYTQLTTVRQVSFDAELQMLCSNPVQEQLALRGELIVNDYDIHIPAGLPAAVSLLPADAGPALDLEIVMQLPKCSGNRCPAFGISILDASSRPGSGAVVTLQQLPRGAGASDDGATDMLNMSLKFGMTDVDYAFPLKPFAASGANGGDTQAVDLRVLVDASVVEVFVLGGRGVVSAAGLPAGNAAHAFVEGGGLLLKVAGYRVGCGWEDEGSPMLKTDDMPSSNSRRLSAVPSVVPRIAAAAGGQRLLQPCSALALPVAVATDATADSIGAAAELARWLQAITNSTVKVVQPSAVPAGAPHFAVGPAAVAVPGAIAGTELSGLNTESFIIRGVWGGTISLSGAANATRGTQYAAMQLLHELGVRFLAADATVVPTCCRDGATSGQQPPQPQQKRPQPQPQCATPVAINMTHVPQFSFRAVDGWASNSNASHALRSHLSPHCRGPGTAPDFGGPSGDNFASPPGFVVSTDNYRTENNCSNLPCLLFTTIASVLVGTHKLSLSAAASAPQNAMIVRSTPPTRFFLAVPVRIAALTHDAPRLRGSTSTPNGIDPLSLPPALLCVSGAGLTALS
jgi:hypothetical protein